MDPVDRRLFGWYSTATYFALYSHVSITHISYARCIVHSAIPVVFWRRVCGVVLEDEENHPLSIHPRLQGKPDQPRARVAVGLSCFRAATIPLRSSQSISGFLFLTSYPKSMSCQSSIPNSRLEETYAAVWSSSKTGMLMIPP